MQKEIGSNFDLNLEEISEVNKNINLEQLNLLGSDSIFLSSGRNSENLVLDEIEIRNNNIKKIALIPSFTCETVIKPFINKGYKIFTYSIDERLRINPNQFKKDLEKSQASIVLIHQYFGFNTCDSITEIIEQAIKKKIIFIEDRTQCLYSNFPCIPTNYIIGSLRKWGPLPDGGFAICKNNKFHIKSIEHDSFLEIEKIKAANLKYKYLYHDYGSKSIYLELFKKAEKLLDNENKYHAISPMSIKIQNNLNIQTLRLKRRENYTYLYKKLRQFNSICIVMGELQKNEIPLYFPIIIDNRKSFQNFLRKKEIYAPIIWPLPKINIPMCDEAKKLYNHLLCIPIDQRYDIDDMKRIYLTIKEYFKNGS